MQPGLLYSAPRLLCGGYEFEMKSTYSILYREHGNNVLIQRSGNRDFLVIWVTEASEVNSINIPTTKRGVEALKRGNPPLRPVQLSTSDLRLPWTPEEKARHEINGHAVYGSRCGTCDEFGGGYAKAKKKFFYLWCTSEKVGHKKKMTANAPTSGTDGGRGRRAKSYGWKLRFFLQILTISD